MSRVVRIELSKRNVALVLALLIAFATVVALVVRSLSHHDARSHDDHGDEHAAPAHEETSHGEQRVELSAQALANAELELASAGPGEVHVPLSLPGEVSLNQDTLAHVTPRVAGTAREVRKNVGEVVKKGEVLALLDSRDLAESQREFLASKERLSLAEATFARAEQLQKENVSAEKDFLEAKQALAEARIEQRSAAQKLQAVGGPGAAGSGYALVAPFAGTIIEKHISVGEVLSEQTRAFTIADLSSVWVNVTVYAKDLSRVAVGQSALVRAEGIPLAAEGTIAYLGQVVGELTRSATARVVLQNPGPAWRPGLFATAEVSVDRARAELVVEDAAIQTVAGKSVVFVQERAGFVVRPLSLGRAGKTAGEPATRVVEVLDGLKPGERYVRKNSFLLKAELGKSEAGHEH
jgi:cobalt-zinc-cadmium efflux system membrane fusion protein